LPSYHDLSRTELARVVEVIHKLDLPKVANQ
jgi:hypothetical protein